MLNLEDPYCCGQLFSISFGVYLIALHCAFQGTYGMCLVITSFYKQPCLIVNLTTIASHGSLLVSAIFLFWAVLYDSWIGTLASLCVLIVVTLCNLASSIAYFVTYYPSEANSLLDKDLFWNNDHDWIDGNSFPFAFWHVLALFLIFTNLVWFYYSFVVYKYSRILKSRLKQALQSV